MLHKSGRLGLSLPKLENSKLDDVSSKLYDAAATLNDVYSKLKTINALDHNIIINSVGNNTGII